MDLIYLDDDMVSLNQNVSTEQAITGKIIHGMFDPHVAQHLGHLKLVLRFDTGLNVCHESLHSMQKLYGGLQETLNTTIQAPAYVHAL